MKKSYTYEVITFAGTVSRRSFDHFGLACDYAILEYKDAVSVFIVRRPTSVTSVDYCPQVWRVEGFCDVSIERASVLDLLAYLV